MNIAIQPSISPAFTQSAMEIDYIRIYQESPTSIVNDQRSQRSHYYPNPVRNTLTIMMEKDNVTQSRVHIYHISGQLLSSGDYYVNDNRLIINGLDELEKGMYIVTYSSQGHVKSIPFIKS
jgi:hypothetical protein